VVHFLDVGPEVLNFVFIHLLLKLFELVHSLLPVLVDGLAYLEAKSHQLVGFCGVDKCAIKVLEVLDAS
jgi:adenosine/AMP kinase